MLTVSDAFMAAVEAPTRQWKPRVTLWFLDNAMLGEFVVPSAGESESIFAAVHVADGGYILSKRWAVARDDCYPADDLYPPGDDHQTGWMSDELADGAAALVPAEELILEYATAQRISEVRWWGDAWLGYPVDFIAYYWDLDALTWIEIATVTANAATEWAYTLPSVVTTTKVKLEISKISRVSDHPYLIEFQGGLVEDVSDEVTRFDAVKERFYEQQGSIPLGNYGAGELNLELENSDDRFSPANTAGPYYGYLRLNRKIEVELGLLVAGAYEYVPVGVYFVSKWSLSSGNPHASVLARDRAKLLQATMFEAAVEQDKLISELVTELAVAGSLDESMYAIDATTAVVPYAVWQKDTIWEYLRQLATGEGGCVYFDEDGHLVFENRDHLAAQTLVQECLDDADNIVTLDHEVDEGRIRNAIAVRSKRLIASALDTIWSLQETLTIPGSGEWWNALYYRRRQFTITADAGAGNNVAANDCLKLEIVGVDAADIFGKCQSDGGDLRLLYNAGGGFVELDRYLEVFTAAQITLYFRAQAPIALGASDDDYWLYYYNPAASAPPEDGSLIFNLYDKFDRAAVGADWNTNKGDVGAAYNLASNHAHIYWDRAGGNFMWAAVQAPGSYWEACVKVSRPPNTPDIQMDGERWGPAGDTVNNAATMYGGYAIVRDPNQIEFLITTPTGWTGSGVQAINLFDSSWHRYRLRRVSTTFTLYMDDVLKVSRLGDAWAPTYFGFLGLIGGIGGFWSEYVYGNAYYDEWWVRFCKAVDPTIVLAAVEPKPAVMIGTNTSQIEVRFQGPAINIEAPVIVSAGPDISVLSYNYNSVGGTIVLQNTGPDETIDGLTIDGQLLVADGELVATARDEPLVAEFGERAYELDNAYIQSLEQAQDMADALLEAYRDPARQITIQMPARGMPHLQLADRVYVVNAKTGIQDDYWIVRQTLAFDGALDSQLTAILATARGVWMDFSFMDNSQYLGVC